ncbi:MAG: hypothetical protein IRY98_05100 [Alicyclobacillaceae bacterium]|nr:hypothetical protein [Alicyclobacillaceae bacterium]
MREPFRYDARLDILVPDLEREWESYTPEEQQEIILRWEEIRAGIPDVIRRFEQEINRRQEQASVEEDWDTVCQLYWEIADFASRIHDLNILYRTEPELAADLSAKRPGISEEHTGREK